MFGWSLCLLNYVCGLWLPLGGGGGGLGSGTVEQDVEDSGADFQWMKDTPLLIKPLGKNCATEEVSPRSFRILHLLVTHTNSVHILKHM